VRVAALYDIHGNLPALEAVLEEIGRAGVDHIVVGGDVVPGPQPRETMSRLEEAGVSTSFIHGNGEREVLAVIAGGEPGPSVPAAQHDAVRWVAQDLLPRQAEAMAAWPGVLRLDVARIGEVLFCHATPRSDTELFTRVTPEERLHEIFDEVDAALVVCGHTHMQFDRMIGGTRVVNAGSVGMRFGGPGADWLLLGPEVELRRTPYDPEAASARILASGYPQASEFVESYVLGSPKEADVLELFERAAQAQWGSR
jgi:predicted phosphodiesterase